MASGVARDAVIAENLVKYYGDFKALDGVSLRVERGEVVALLGPNGAGKTTTIGILCGLMSADAGRAFVLGVPSTDKDGVSRLISYAPQETALDYLMSVEDNLRFIGWLRGLRGGRLRERIERALREFGLLEKRGVPVIALSGGLMRRVQLAGALMLEREVLVLDEPTLGLDPMGKMTVWQMVRERARRGAAVLVATNDMHEAEVLADRIAFLNRGRIVAFDTADRLKALSGSSYLRLRLEPGWEDLVSPPRGSRVLGDGWIEVEYRDPGEVAEIVASLSGARILDMRLRGPTLDDVFRKLATESEAVPEGGGAGVRVVAEVQPQAGG